MAARGATSDARDAPGLLSSLRALGATLVGILEARVQLVANELEEQRLRLLELLLFGAIALFLAFMAALLFTALLVMALWDAYGLGALAGVAVGYLLLAVGAALFVRARAAQRDKVLATSIAELRTDRDLLER